MECAEWSKGGGCSIRIAWEALGDGFANTHHEGASALLDGFTVAEVTAAERELER